MLTEDIFARGLGLQSPWTLKGQRFDMEKYPSELDLIIGAERGAQSPCPKCNELCKAHDFLDMTWRHLNFFQHLCFLTASVPRVECPVHGIHRVKVPWARQDSGFTLLFAICRLHLLLLRLTSSPTPLSPWIGSMSANCLQMPWILYVAPRPKQKRFPKVHGGPFSMGDMARTDEQQAALKELAERGLHTATAFRGKELLRCGCARLTPNPLPAWRATRFLAFARKLVGEEVILKPLSKALNSFEKHFSMILRHWHSLLSNARLEGMNGLFQAARARARG